MIEQSGRYQQKVVVAKSLVQSPRLVIFDGLTRGVDVGAIAEIHEGVRGLASRGMAILFISSYVPKALHLADRILVTRQSRVVEGFTPETADEDKIMYAAVH